MPLLEPDKLKTMFETRGLGSSPRGNRWILGALLIALGVLAASSGQLLSLVSIAIYAAVLLGGGVLEVIHAFQRRSSGDFLPHLLAGVFALLAGALLLLYPRWTLASLAALLGAYFVAAGAFRGGAALMHRHAGWGWTVLRACVSLVLGTIVLASWPASSLTLLGLLLGADLIASGLSLMAVPRSARPAAGQA